MVWKYVMKGMSTLKSVQISQQSDGNIPSVEAV